MNARLPFGTPVGRLGWALGLSAAVHLALILTIQSRPGGAPSWAGARTLEARIEPAPANPTSVGDVAVGTPAPPSDEPERKAEPATPVPDAAESARERVAEQAARTVPAGAQEREARRAEPRAVGAEMPFVRDPEYYVLAALDHPPRPLGPTDICFPQGATGKVEFSLLINEHGDVDRILVAAVQPAGLFTGAATDLCSRLKFSPGVKDGRAVRSRVRLVLEQRPG